MKIPAIVAARTSIKNTLPLIKTRINNAYNPVNPALPYVNRGAEVSRQKTKINSINEFLFNKVEIIRFNRKHLPPFSAWYINPDNSSNVVFYIHGLGANITNYQNLYEKLLKKNVGIFAVEYRGHGENPKARVNESKIENDLERAYQYLIQQKKVAEENIVVLGHSMGCVLASNLVAKHQKVKSLILVSPMCDVNHLGEKFVQNKTIGLGIPKEVYDFSQKYKFLQWMQSWHFNSLASIIKNRVPLSIIHSNNDNVTTVAGAKRLAAAARKNNALSRLTILPKGGHQIDMSKTDAIISEVGRIYN